jgi:hypothetical protein
MARNSGAERLGPVKLSAIRRKLLQKARTIHLLLVVARATQLRGFGGAGSVEKDVFVTSS